MSVAFHPVVPSLMVGGTFNGTCPIFIDELSDKQLLRIRAS